MSRSFPTTTETYETVFSEAASPADYVRSTLEDLIGARLVVICPQENEFQAGFLLAGYLDPSVGITKNGSPPEILQGDASGDYRGALCSLFKKIADPSALTVVGHHGRYDTVKLLRQEDGNRYVFERKLRRG